MPARCKGELTGAIRSARGIFIHTYNLCLLGFGNVNRTLVSLFEDRRRELLERHAISWRITGVASRRLGWLADAQGFESATLLALTSDSPPSRSQAEATAPPNHVRDWLAAAKADVLFEATSLNLQDGQPAVDHIRAALDHGAHAVTANKGPIVHAYRQLRDLAAARGKRFLFESTVMDGAPIFSLFRELPGVHLLGFHGVLNSTTNVMLGEMEQGLSFQAALQKAQELGVAETDASHDIDGWDASVKTAALITVLMDQPVRPQEIEREGIGALSGESVRAARAAGHPYKLVCRAQRAGAGIKASVRPEKIPIGDPMARMSGTSSYVQFNTDIFPGLAITEENPGLNATAYGMLADFVRAVRD